jgi:hypothetical protein
VNIRDLRQFADGMPATFWTELGVTEAELSELPSLK